MALSAICQFVVYLKPVPNIDRFLRKEWQQEVWLNSCFKALIQVYWANKPSCQPWHSTVQVVGVVRVVTVLTKLKRNNSQLYVSKPDPTITSCLWRKQIDLEVERWSPHVLQILFVCWQLAVGLTGARLVLELPFTFYIPTCLMRIRCSSWLAISGLDSSLYKITKANAQRQFLYKRDWIFSS